MDRSAGAEVEKFNAEWRKSCTVRECSVVAVDSFVQAHYLRKRPAIVLLCLMMMHGARPVGCVIYSAPPREADKRYGGKTWELARLYLLDEIPRNAESWLIAASVRWIKRHRREVACLVSYADPSVGHSGVIYRAANWRADGRTDDERKTARCDYFDARTGKGWAGVADPHIFTDQRSDSYGVNDWSEPASTVLAHGRHDNARATIADPRLPRVRREGSLGVTGWHSPSTTVVGKGAIHNGPWQVADPRIGHGSRGGNLGMTGWADPTHTVIGSASGYHGDNVADPRVPEIVGPPLDLDDKRPCYVVIRANDGTWHRPLTTLKLAVIQSFPAQVRGIWLTLPGNDAQRRSLIGNAVPPMAAEAIARTIKAALESAMQGGGFRLSAEDIWVSNDRQQVAA